jgi:hypothetical protein
MTKTKIILSVIALAAAVIIPPISLYVTFVGSTEELIKRFPDIDPQIVWDASKEMFFDTLQGKNSHIVDDADGSTGEYDRIFLEKVHKLTSK